jgi:small ligand-binding sensory domain FIST
MTDARFAAACSTRHDTTLALREAAESLGEGLAGRSPDLLVVFASRHHAAEVEILPRRLGELTGARVLLGCTADTVIGDGHELEHQPAIALWGVACEALEVTPFRVGAHPAEGGADDDPPRIEYTGHPDLSRLGTGSGSSVLLLGDPYSFPMADYLERLAREAPDLIVTGGMASGASRPGETALFLGGERWNSGAVGVHLSGGITPTTVVSQAYRPIGRPWVITDCEGAVVRKLGGRSAARVMMETLDALPEEDRELLRSAPMLGVAWDANRSTFEPTDFLAHPIRGVAPKEDALVLIGEVRRGLTVQLMLQDPYSAGDDLTRRLERHAGAPPATPHEAGALLFSCNARGRRMFEEPDHDVRRVRAALGAETPLAGLFAMGEIARIGQGSQLHGFTAATVIYRGV